EALGQHNAVVLGGEPVVAGVPEGSLGGPIQEAVLAAALELESDLFDWLVMGLATDGRDGPTDATGAAIDRTMLRHARDRGLPLEDAIHSHNSHPLISDMNALIRTGPTGTNVNDVLIAIRR
ncbi:MAG: MOFRL family protein, partial [Phycisphaerales bacterium JB058]